MKSLRDRLVIGALVTMGAVLAVGGGAVYTSVRQRLKREFDRSLESLAQTASIALVTDHVRLLRSDPELRPRLSPLDALLQRQDLFLQGWTEDGRDLARSEALGDAVLPRFGDELDVPAFGDATLDDRRTVRVVSIAHRPPGLPAHRPPRGSFDRPPRPERPGPPGEPPVLVVSVARSDADVRGALAHLRRILLLTWAGAILVGAALLTVVVRRSLRPLSTLGAEIAQLDDTRLDRPIVVANAPSELAPVVDQLNDSVARLGRSFDRERAFAASAAHELRTPLAGLRATLEVSASREREPAEHLEAERTCLEIVDQMQSLMEGLLELARGEATPAAGPPHAFADDVTACLEGHASTLASRRLTVDPDLPRGPQVGGDPRLLRRVVDNVITNAVTYADDSSALGVAVAHDGDHVTLTVTNRTTGLPPDAGERAFDTFWRADAAREAGVHAGLGLPLCRRIAERLGGTISATSEDESFVITLRLPAS